MLSVIAAPSYRLHRPQNFDGSSVETVYRHGLSAIAAVPALLAALILAFAAFEHFRIGSIPSAESIALSIGGPFVVVLALLWTIVVWYGTCVCLSEKEISLHKMSVLFGVRTREIRWEEIVYASFVSNNSILNSKIVISSINNIDDLAIKNIAEIELMYHQMIFYLHRSPDITWSLSSAQCNA